MTASDPETELASRAAPVATLAGITKRFGRTLANDDVSLELWPSEVHALVGENGAGKSTLMRVLYGMHAPDGGTMHVHGSAYRPRSPRDAIRLGIGMVHQHFQLIENMTVVDNVLLGAEPTVGGIWVDRPRAAARVEELAARHGLPVDPWARVDTLSVGEQQRVEILKALYRDASLLILDEPTAVLTPGEVRGLLECLRSLRTAGKSIVIITHKLEEALSLADRITVMRRGRVSGRRLAGETDRDDLVRLMIGRDVTLPSVNRTGGDTDAAPVLEVRGLQVAGGGAGRPRLDDVSFELRAGEVLGVAGVEGNGQSELVEALIGLRRTTAGTVRVAGEELGTLGVRARRERGIALVPEDRHRRGLVLAFSIAENLLLGHHREGRFARLLGIDRDAARAAARAAIRDFDVRGGGESTPVSALSGGNQQKVVIARELAFGARVLLAHNPTRGVDIGAIESIHARLLAERDRGVGILLVSSELSELFALSDRLMVMHAGRVVAVVDPQSTTPDAVGALMLGRPA